MRVSIQLDDFDIGQELDLFRSGKSNTGAIVSFQGIVRNNSENSLLNMDIEQIYFSNLKKFDGKKTRRLNLIEISQIAGRAGRYKNDGNFGTTGDPENLNTDEIEKIESHNLPEVKLIYWRNSDLKFESPEKLISSLELKPNNKSLIRTNESIDESVLRFLLKKLL